MIVRDFGAGIQPRSFTEERTLGLGLPLIATLSSQLRDPRRRAGPRARGRHDLFAPADARRAPRASAAWQRDPADHPFDSPRAAGLLIQPGPLVASVASRVTAILAARADFPLDRLADAVLVSDAIAAHASDYISGSDVGLVIEDGDGTLDFRVGPLHEGGARGPAARDGGPRPRPVAGAPRGRGQVERGDGVPGTAESARTPSSSPCASARTSALAPRLARAVHAARRKPGHVADAATTRTVGRTPHGRPRTVLACSAERSTGRPRTHERAKVSRKRTGPGVGPGLRG